MNERWEEKERNRGHPEKKGTKAQIDGGRETI